MIVHPADVADRLEHAAWLLRSCQVTTATANAAAYAASARDRNEHARDDRRYDARLITEQVLLLDAIAEQLIDLTHRWTEGDAIRCAG